MWISNANSVGEDLQRLQLKLGRYPLQSEQIATPITSGKRLCGLRIGLDETAFASYLIRARLRKDAKVTPLHVRTVVSMPSYRHRMLQEAKTTAGNYNVNIQGLRSLPIIEPPKEIQVTYARLVSQTLRVVTNGRQALRQTEGLFASLSQRAFAGEL